MLWSVVVKSFKEQVRNYWVLLLTIVLAPFFVAVYYMINESQEVHYDLLVLNQDQGVIDNNDEVNFGTELLKYLNIVDPDSLGLPLTTREVQDRDEAEAILKDRKADALIVFPEDFSVVAMELIHGQDNVGVPLEIVGDLTSVGYMVSAIWVNEIITGLIYETLETPRPLAVTETSLGLSGEIDEFDYYMPGIMILAVIMLMFSATNAIITEVDQQTILRLKLSRLSSATFLSGISIIQILVGLISIILTLCVAALMGFELRGSFWVFLLLAVLTSISIIAFSLLLAASVRNVNEVLTIGNFPLFLFMFFTGAAFPMNPKVIFTIGGYGVGWTGFMSATHAVDAMRKIMVMEQNLGDIVPEILALLICTLVYFVLGVWAFQRRHLSVE